MIQPYQQAPAGAVDKSIPVAPLADIQTSRELVASGDQDAHYFRTLEQAGILLNSSQIEAVRHHDGPLLTLAGAGSGKTTVLICRTGYLIAVRRVNPRQILLLTFSSKAAAEMKERLGQLPAISPEAAGRVEARTFHSFFLYFLRRQGYEEEILSDTSRQHMLLKRIMRSMNLQDSYQPETLLSVLSSYKMNMIGLEDLPDKTDQEKELKEIFTLYERWKEENRKLDFDDVLLKSYYLLQRSPGLLEALQNRFRYVMNDEFQDTNKLQYKLLRMLAYPENNIMAVGDDDQTIYTFNGAKSEFILRFDKQFPGATVVTLDINYRSTDSIIGLGNEIIRRNVNRRKKTLKAVKPSAAAMAPRYMRPSDQDEEAASVIFHMLDAVEAGRRSLGDFAVLYRSASNARAILEQLVLRGIPFVDFGDGQLLYEHGVVKPLIAHLRLSLHRRDFEAIENLAGSLYLNREKAMEHIRAKDTPKPVKGPLAHLLSYPGLKEFQVTKIRERLEMIRSLAQMKPAEAIALMRKSFYDAYLDADKRQQLTQHKETLREMLDETEQSAGRFDSVEAFVTYIDEVSEKASESARSRREEQGDKIALMTIHKSKGLEFPAVFLIGASEGSLPHSSALEADRMADAYVAKDGKDKTAAALEEERRLAYVAVTRAKEELFISSPALYRGKKAAVSRFVLAAFSPAAPASTSPAGGGRNMASSTSRNGGSTAAAEGGSRNAASAARNSGNTAEPGGSREAAALSSRTAAVPRPAPQRRPSETVLAWRCTKPGCTAWSRISSYEEEQRPDKTCPLCQSPMVKGSKQI
jgi:DNA helicase II / ATP-dependent DNA helicase PcrA